MFVNISVLFTLTRIFFKSNALLRNLHIEDLQDTGFFPFKAGSFSFRYSQFGETVCYSSFTDIASFITGFTILYPFLKFPITVKVHKFSH